MPDRIVCSHFAFHVPERVVTNDELASLMETSDEWIVQRTGIKTRHWVSAPTSTSDLAVAAARETLRLSGSNRVDAVIAATLSPDFCFPGIGVLIQTKLGLPTVPAFDLRNQCSGFLFGIELAKSLVACGKYERVLLAGAEVHSTGLDISTRGRDIAVLFGDGAGTCLVQKEQSSCSVPQFEIVDTLLHSDGAFATELWCEHPGSAHFPTRLTPDLVSEAKIFPSMNGRKVFENAVKSMTESSIRLLSRNGLTAAEVSLLVPHQANLRINQMVGSQLGLAPEKVFNTIERFGNTTAATIPIGMACAVSARRLHAGDYVLNAAFGSGFTWGAALLKVV